jgi:hypothetical protein
MHLIYKTTAIRGTEGEENNERAMDRAQPEKLQGSNKDSKAL